MNLLTKASFSSGVGQRERDNRQTAYQAACEGMVLLKNDGALPFQAKKIALYGSGASKTIKGGTGSGEVNERRSISILEGLMDRGFEIATHRWLADFHTAYEEAREAQRKETMQKLKRLKGSLEELLFEQFQPPCGRAVTQEDVDGSGTDSCIYVVSRQAGEGGDRKAEKGSLFLTDESWLPSASARKSMRGSYWLSTAVPRWIWGLWRRFPASTPLSSCASWARRAAGPSRTWPAARSPPPAS